MADACVPGSSDPLGTFVGDDLDLTGQPRGGAWRRSASLWSTTTTTWSGGYCWARKEGVARTSKDQRRSL